MRRHIVRIVMVLALVWSVAPLGAATSPATVSPGSAREVTMIDQRCPAFSWGAVEGARGYELVVYGLSDGAEAGLKEAEPLLRERLPGGALSWTPSMARCLSPGGRYAWLVRSDGEEGASDWSEPRLFQVAVAPSAAEVEQALAVLQAYLAGGGVELGRDLGEVSPTAESGALGASRAGSGDGSEGAAAPEGVPIPDVTAILGSVPDPLGVTFGLHGISASSEDFSAGVVGESTATSGFTFGVIGSTDSPGGAGVVAFNSATTGAGVGLFATTQTSDGFAVDGEAEATSGSAVGVLGATNSPGGAGVRAAHRDPLGGADLVLDGSEQGLTDTVLTESGLDRSSVTPETFTIENTSNGGMTLVVEGDVSVGGLVDGVDVSSHVGDANAHHTPPTALPPSGPAAGDLSGTFPNPDVVDDSHAHTGATVPDLWVNETGDTMTGTLTTVDVELGGRVLRGGQVFLHEPGGAGLSNTGLGRFALSSITTGTNNTASGKYALYRNTTGSFNTASGPRALENNTAGSRNTASGYVALFNNTTAENNTASGYTALFSNTTGTRNTASGSRALFNNTTANYNTAAGYKALFSNTTGAFNTASGSEALHNSTTGNHNTASGARALRSNTTGYGNTASGSSALRNNTTASNNTASGASALQNNTFGSRNTASGAYALYKNTGGFYNSASGNRALNDNSTGSRNTATGYAALFSNTIGLRNTASGSRALYSNTTGDNNTGSGNEALFSNTIGNSNTASGHRALYANITGTGNTASGYKSLYANTTGFRNIATGHRALYSNTTGSGNTASGYRPLFQTTGSRNTGVGPFAGSFATTGSDNIFLGSGSSGAVADTNTIRIGGSVVGTGNGQQNQTFINGIRSVTIGNANAIPVLIDSAGQLGTASSSRRFKKEIEEMGEASEGLLALRPVTFKYKQEPVEGVQPLQFGLIAEEVAEVLPDLVVYDEEGRPETVRYHLLSSMLLNELQK